MKVEATPVTAAGLRYIVGNLRPRDRREIFALRWNDDEEQLVQEISAAAGELWRMWSLEGEPVAVNGVVPVRPGVVIAGAFGTPRWRSIIKPMTRWSLDYVIPLLRRANYHRGEAYVLSENTDSRRWIELLGGEVEAVLKGFGRQREDFLLYAWDLTREKERDRVFLRRKRPENRATDGVCQLH
jgi:hypothetical protein